MEAPDSAFPLCQDRQQEAVLTSWRKRNNEPTTKDLGEAKTMSLMSLKVVSQYP